MISKKDFPILVIDDELRSDNVGGRAIRTIIKELQNMGFSVIEELTSFDGKTTFLARPDISCVLLDWDLGIETKDKSADPVKLIQIIREKNEDIPIFIMTERLKVEDIPLEIIETINDYVWKTEDMPDFIAGRINRSVLNYFNKVVPPFFKELIKYVNESKYAWHTPGHMGGTAYLKSPVGRVFFDFFGENTLRSDLSVSVPELGSLLEHVDPVGAAERNAAKIFGADRTYFVTNGTSTANKIVFHGCVVSGDIILVDRNCHKSVMHAIIMTGAVPVYLIPTRNSYGVIGPIHKEEFKLATIKKKLTQSKLIKEKDAQGIKLAVVTNSTYDGLCYNVEMIKEDLKNIVENMHFDEAWYGYAKFHPLYKNRYGMSGKNDNKKHPNVFATQSTHKVLAAFSQGSMVHVKDGKKPLEHDRFNEAYMMHTSTSPQYGIIASLDVGAKMMEGKGGKFLIEESIDEAIIFRKKMAQLGKEIKKKNKEWWFKVWQPEKLNVKDARNKNIEDVKENILKENSECWILERGKKWHGFEGLEKDYILLDPIKVTILTPGINENGRVEKSGIPASLVSKFLMDKGIVAEKTGFYSILFLFTIGITKGKSGTLLAELFEFKKLFDKNISVGKVFPDLLEKNPEKYKNLNLQELAKEIHDYLSQNDIANITKNVYADLPGQEMIPAEAYSHIVKGNVEKFKLNEIEGKVSAVMVVPYPPGIPVIMPGERFTKKIIDYLRLYEEFDNNFPGFENEIHGVEVKQEKDRSIYYIYCLK